MVKATRKPTTSRNKSTKAPTQRSAPVQTSLAQMLLGQISNAIHLLNSTEDNSRDPGFAFSVEATELADAFSYVVPNSPEAALAHACMLYADIDNLDGNENSEYKTRLLFHRIRLRTFWLAGWIEREHGIRREDHNLDYFHDIDIAYRNLVPHEPDRPLGEIVTA